MGLLVLVERETNNEAKVVDFKFDFRVKLILNS